MITSASVTIHGDSSAGISDHIFTVESLDADPDLVQHDDRQAFVEAIRGALLGLGKVIGDGRVSVFLIGWDDR